MTASKGRAVVLGASMAGLLAARVLSGYYAEVVVIDRDRLDDSGPRRGVPQGLHTHGILARGREVMEGLFPGLTAELADLGAVPVDLRADVAWYHGATLTAPTRSDLLGLCVGRPTLEDAIRARVTRLSTVDIRGGYEAVDLLADPDRRRVTGVVLADTTAGHARTDLSADLVVDATGRGNRGPTWLAALGYDRPAEESVNAGIAYATRVYHRSGPGLPSGFAAALNTLTSDLPRSFIAFPIEGDRWIVTLVGLGDDIPPTDPAGFDAFAHRIPVPDLHAIVDHATPLTEPRRFRVPASVRRRYERLPVLPDGYLIVGDALCAFNPVYGQGMTVAAIEAEVLRECLRDPGPGLPRRFFARAARVIDIPWDMAVGGDLALESVPGRRTPKIRILNAYLARVLRAAETDPVVGTAFHRAINLTIRPQGLFAPAILRRVLFPRPDTAAPRTPTAVPVP